MRPGDRNHRPDPVKSCQAALRVGFLTKATGSGHWVFGRRKFHPATVRALIDNGYAVRVGDHIVRWSQPS